MFEDSTFETMGTIRTRSRGWMMATLAFNSSILLALAIIPILHPEMLPQITSAIRMVEPPPMEQQRPTVRTEQTQTTPMVARPNLFEAPPTIPRQIYIPSRPEEPTQGTWIELDQPTSGASSPDNPFDGHGTQPIVRQAAPATQHISSGVMQGMLIYKVVPTYPAVAQAIRASGTVILQATISKTGAIENLRVVDGPTMLRQAAMDAVRQWRYKPYLLNGQPVEVETTVNVEFKME